MSKRIWVLSLLFSATIGIATAAENRAPVAGDYKALKYTPPISATGTWGVLDRNGANQQVEKYLSSLAGGEVGTGVIVSPAFQISGDKITFTLCGHDGPQGGLKKKNYLALVDVRKGRLLRQTMAPGGDAMQEKSWDVAPFQGLEVRVEIHDGDDGTAFAWMGVGKIDAGSALRVDFRGGVPKGWVTHTKPVEIRTEILSGGVPFLRYPAVYSMIPASGALEVPCGFAAERLFFLGCTLPSGRPGETYATLEIVYRDGSSERVPLIYGYTLDLAGKTLSKSKAMYLHASSDVFQHYFAVAPKPEVISKIVLRRSSESDVTAQITAITCQTQAASDHLQALPQATVSPEEAAWIQAHTITATSPGLDAIRGEIRRAHKLQ